MFEGLKEALQYVNGLKEESMQPIVTEIAGKTYCNKDLKRYGREDLADPIYVNTLLQWWTTLPERRKSSGRR